MSSSSFGGMSRLKRIGAGGSKSSMALKIRPEVSPWNGKAPVAISYKTTPNSGAS
jgi:hypothetical protein